MHDLIVIALGLDRGRARTQGQSLILLVQGNLPDGLFPRQIGKLKAGQCDLPPPSPLV